MPGVFSFLADYSPLSCIYFLPWEANRHVFRQWAPCTLASSWIQPIGSVGRRLEGEKRLTPPLGSPWGFTVSFEKGPLLLSRQSVLLVPRNHYLLLPGRRLSLASGYWPIHCPHLSKQFFLILSMSSMSCWDPNMAGQDGPLDS